MSAGTTGAARKPRPPRAGARAGRAANPARGEHSLTLAGTAYRLRPSFQAVQALEDDLGLSLVEMVRKANAFALTLEQLGTIVAELVRAGAEDEMTRAVSAERMAELVFEEGTGPVFAALVLALADAVMGGRTTSGEAKAALATATH